MQKVIPLVLLSATMVGGCVMYPDEFYDPYSRSSSMEFGYYNGWPTYYSMPHAYYRSCNGIYGMDGRCYVQYHRPYGPMRVDQDEDDTVIPLTQPPVMVNDDLPVLWRDVERDQLERGRIERRQPTGGTVGLMDWRSARPLVVDEPVRQRYSTRRRPDAPSPYVKGSRDARQPAPARSSSSRPSAARSPSSSSQTPSTHRSAPRPSPSSPERIR